MLKVATTTFKNELEALWQAWGTFWFDRINNNWYLLGCTVIFCLGFVTISTFAKSLTPLFAVLGFVVFASAMAAVTYVSVETTPLGVKHESSLLDDADLIEAVLLGEARGEGEAGIDAVSEVIRTRMILGKESASLVVRRSNQFSCLNGRGRAEMAKLLLKWRKESSQHVRIAAGANAQWLARGWGASPFSIPARGCTHFHAASLGTAHWAVGEPSVQIGNHVFYRLPYP